MALPYPQSMFGGHDPFDLIAGLEEPTMDTAEPTDPLYHEPGRGAGFLEALGQTYRPVQANDFGTAFANSLLGGLAAKGRTVAEKRAQHEARLETRRSARDKANISATEDYLKRRADSKARFASEARTDQRADTKDRTTYERDFVQVPADAPAWVRRLTDKEGRVPRSVLADALKPEKAPRAEAEPLVAVQTPDGPRLMRRSQAEGKEPARTADRPTLKPPTASERDQLTTDSSLLQQVGDIRSAFNAKFVGPVSGRLGAAATTVGVQMLGHPQGEQAFRGRVAALRNQVLKARSGGAVTDGEAQRLLEELPVTNNPSGNFLDKLDTFEKILRDIATSRREIMSATGVDLSKMPALPTSSPQAPRGAASGRVAQASGAPTPDEVAAYKAHLARTGVH